MQSCFMREDPDDIRVTNDVENKWGVHTAWEERDAWVTDDYRTTALVLFTHRVATYSAPTRISG